MEIISAVERDDDSKLQYLLTPSSSSSNDMKAVLKTISSLSGGSSLLHHAAENNSLKCLAYLIKKTGLDINAVDDSGATSMHRAATHGNLPALKMLMDHGAHQDVKDSKGETPLLAAAAKGKLDAIRFLVENGTVNIDAQSLVGFSALHYAAQNGQGEIISYLLTKGANSSLKDINQQTAVQVARDEHPAYVKFFDLSLIAAKAEEEKKRVEKESLADQIERLKEENEKLKQTIEDSDERNKSLSLALKSAEAFATQSLEKVTLLTKENESLAEQNQKLEKASKTYHDEINELRCVIEKQAVEMQNLSKETAAAKANNNIITSSPTPNGESANRELKHQLQIQSDQISELKDRLEEKIDVIAKLEAQKRSMVAELDDLNGRCESLSKDKFELQQKLEKLSNNPTTASNNSNPNSEMSILKSQNNDLRATVTSLQSTIATLEQLLEKQQTSAAQLSHSATAEFVEERQKLIADLTKVTQERDIGKMILTNAVSELNNLTEEKKRLEKALVDASAGNLNPSTAKASSSADLLAKTAELQKAIESTQKLFASSQQTLVVAAQQCDALGKILKN